VCFLKKSLTIPADYKFILKFSIGAPLSIVTGHGGLREVRMIGLGICFVVYFLLVYGAIGGLENLTKVLIEPAE